MKEELFSQSDDRIAGCHREEGCHKGGPRRGGSRHFRERGGQASKNERRGESNRHGVNFPRFHSKCVKGLGGGEVCV